MDRINSQNLVRPGLVDKYKGAQRSDSAQQADTEQATGLEKSNTRPTIPADSADISEAARKMVDLRAAVDTGRMALEELPDVRDEKVALARKRLEQGFYQSAEVQGEVAAKLGNVLKQMDDL